MDFRASTDMEAKRRVPIPAVDQNVVIQLTVTCTPERAIPAHKFTILFQHNTELIQFQIMYQL